jgi:uncharacterized protein YegL
VCLCLDISGSMQRLYSKGLVQAFAERILALGCRFDDDGEIDVFLFGARVHQPEPMGVDNNRRYIEALIGRFGLEGDTRYGLAMQAIRQFYFQSAPRRGDRVVADTPVYVMFVTDGAPSDRAVAEEQVRQSSHEPIFWQFMGIGKSNKPGRKTGFWANLFQSNFTFLETLDVLPGRLIDNAGFFSVEGPDEYPDEELYDLLMSEYPQWVKRAKALSLFQ